MSEHDAAVYKRLFEAVEAQLATARADAAVLAETAATVVRIVKEKWGSANEFPALNKALAAHEALKTVPTEGTNLCRICYQRKEMLQDAAICFECSSKNK